MDAKVHTAWPWPKRLSKCKSKYLWKQGLFLAENCQKCMVKISGRRPTSYLTINCIFSNNHQLFPIFFLSAFWFWSVQFRVCKHFVKKIYYKHMAGSQWWRRCRNVLTNKHAARDSKTQGRAEINGGKATVVKAFSVGIRWPLHIGFWDRKWTWIGLFYGLNYCHLLETFVKLTSHSF